MKIHRLKTWPKYFRAIYDESKTFEVRKNDRNFKVGDILELEEWEPETGEYTGRKVRKLITYILKNVDYIHPDYCVLAIHDTVFQ